MATFIALIDFTDQGITKIRDTTQRSATFAEEARALGAEVKETYWPMGAHDGVLIFEAPDDETASALLLQLGSRGIVRTQVLRAFDRSERDGILARL